MLEKKKNIKKTIKEKEKNTSNAKINRVLQKKAHIVDVNKEVFSPVPSQLKKVDAFFDMVPLPEIPRLEERIQKGILPIEVREKKREKYQDFDFFKAYFLPCKQIIPLQRTTTFVCSDKAFYEYCQEISKKYDRIFFIASSYTEESENIENLIPAENVFTTALLYEGALLSQNPLKHEVKIHCTPIYHGSLYQVHYTEKGECFAYLPSKSYQFPIDEHQENILFEEITEIMKDYLAKRRDLKDFESAFTYAKTLSFHDAFYFFVGFLPFSDYQRQILMQATYPEVLEVFSEFFAEDERYISLKEKISRKLQKELDKHQKEYFLREQLQVIHRELGDSETVEQERDNYLKTIKKLAIPEEYKEILKKEVNKLVRYPQGVPEATILRNYLDLVISLPWGKLAKENLKLSVAREELDKNHKHLEKVKERILQYLAVRKMQMEDKNYLNPTILCLVGPPGVGKTSIAKSMANALGRPYVRMSLGGVRDEAEIRGHRRTYVGAMPGRLISSLRQAKFDNPLILLDEIDKLGHDFRGDPSSALLELLDPGQNDSFRDHYLEIPYDFSKVLFVTTANSLESIPEPLLDRLEVLVLEGYTDLDKLAIAKEHLWKKQLEKASMKEEIALSDELILHIIRSYTRESGVRQLERELSKLIRKIALMMEEKQWENKEITIENLSDYLSSPKFQVKQKLQGNYVGLVTGLAWTSAGGDVLPIEVLSMPGKGKLELTGNLGQVMKESAQVALSFVRSYADKLGLEPEIFEKTDLHIHVPEGAVPKDGPSAGITLTLAIASALTKKEISSSIAMTGEVSMIGRVLAIGGLKEKLLAAKRYGITKVYLPKENEHTWKDLSEDVKDGLQVVFLEHVSTLLEAELLQKN